MTPILNIHAGWIQLMLSVISLVAIVDTIIGGWQILLRRKLRYIVSNLLLFVIAYIFLNILQDMNYYKNHQGIEKLAYPMCSGLPVEVVLVVIVILIMATIHSFRIDMRYEKNNITPNSIQESFNYLPTAVCCYKDGGLVSMKNALMDRLSFEIMGNALSNGEDFWKNLSEGIVKEEIKILEGGKNPMMQLKNGKVYSFTKRKVFTENSAINELCAVDVTTEYESLQILSRDKFYMEKLNRRLREYSRRVVEVTIEKEILAAKVKIHDELGHALIISEQYLKGKYDNRETLLELWKRNIALLKEDDAEEQENDYETMHYIARCAGIQIHIEGKLPETSESIQKIVVTAMSECVTNTNRHAHGENIYVEVKEEMDSMELKFHNDGIQPDKDIVEGGGLTGLRKMVEGIGGSMQIQSKPTFIMKLYIPREERKDGL